MKGYEVFLKKYITPDVYQQTLDSVFGEEWRNKEDAWEPETIRQEIERIWAVEPIDEVFEKIMALQTYLTTDLFWDDLIAFENMVLAFNDRHVDPDLVQSCTPEELAYGVEVASRVRSRRDWIIDIIEYIRACHRQYGQLVYHEVLKFAQPKYKDERADLVKRIDKQIKVGVPRLLDEDSIIEVQAAKTDDCDAYVRERLMKGK